MSHKRTLRICYEQTLKREWSYIWICIKVTALKGWRASWLAHSMSSVGVYWRCICQDLVRKTEATSYFPGIKDLSIGSVGLNNYWSSRESKVREATLVTSVWSAEADGPSYQRSRCSEPLVRPPLCFQLLSEINSHSFSSTFHIL